MSEGADVLQNSLQQTGSTSPTQKPPSGKLAPRGLAGGKDFRVSENRFNLGGGNIAQQCSVLHSVRHVQRSVLSQYLQVLDRPSACRPYKSHASHTRCVHSVVAHLNLKPMEQYRGCDSVFL